MKIVKLLEAIKDFEVVVPEFQREYVWNLEQAKELMISLFNDYPTGSILVWETNSPPEIKNNAVKTDKVGWIKVLLDGQQRLTTLFLLTKGAIPPYYKETDILHDPRHLYFNLQTGEFNYFQKQKMKDNPLWKSVVSCFNEKFDAFSIMAELGSEQTESQMVLGQKINTNLNCLRGILEKEYFVQSVPQGVNIDKAIDIFDRVNSLGTKLTDAELVLTHIGGKWPQVRRFMKEKIIDYEKTGFFFDLDFLTRCMVVLLTDSALYVKMTDEIYSRTNEDVYKNTWKKLVKILDYLIPILKQSAYLSGTDDISTINVLVPLIAYLGKKDCRFSGEEKQDFLYWMFLASIWGRYSGQTDQHLDRDIFSVLNSANPVDDLVKEIEDARGRIEVKPADLEGRGASHPLHRMLYIITKYQKAIDWSNGGSLQDTLGDYFSIQSHHVFPQAFLYRNGYDSENHLHKKIVNEIANRAFITRDTNFEILDEDPKIYLKEVLTKYPKALAQQMIPEDTSLWEVKNYEHFLQMRRKLIADNINQFLKNLRAKFSTEVEKTDYELLVQKGENNFVEFKASLRWDYDRDRSNPDLELNVTKTLAGFMNSEGGILLIGVDDQGQILGLEKDYSGFHKKNKDGFLLQLTQLVSQNLGKEFYQYMNFEITELQGKEVCAIKVSGSDMPVYVKSAGKDAFYVRAAASTQPLSLSESNAYIKTHWD